MKDPTLAIAGSSLIRSETIASASADLAMEGRYSAGRPGGHNTMRRASPARSMSAAAATIWSVVEIRTELPLSSWHRPPSTEPASKSRRVNFVSGLETKGSHTSTVLLIASQREELFCNVFIKIDKISERYRKL